MELINNIYKEISLKSMEEAGEGVVLYFCEEGKCLSLAKLKTIDCMCYQNRKNRSIGEEIEREIEVVCSGEQDSSVIVWSLQGGSVGDGGRLIDLEGLQPEH